MKKNKNKKPYEDNFESTIIFFPLYVLILLLILHPLTTITTDEMRQIILLAITATTGSHQSWFKPLQDIGWFKPLQTGNSPSPFVTFLGTVSRKWQKGKSGLISEEPCQRRVMICSWWTHTIRRPGNRRNLISPPFAWSALKDINTVQGTCTQFTFRLP